MDTLLSLQEHHSFLAFFLTECAKARRRILAMRTAAEARRVTRLRQDVGMATAADVAEREAALAEAEQAFSTWRAGTPT
ncbi:MAG: hypothetical protein AB1402_02170 [Bacillota bacterium]